MTAAFLVVSVTFRAIGCPLFVIWAMHITKIGRYIWAREDTDNVSLIASANNEKAIQKKRGNKATL